MSVIPDELAWHVLAHFGVEPVEVRALGNHGGFSGARLWHVRNAAGDWCLKAWPAGGMDAVRLGGIHGLMRQARDAGLPFILVPFAARNDSTVLYEADRVWDLTTWMPGRADYHAKPSAERLRAACVALARLHLAWQPAEPVFQSFPAVRRRVESARSWCALVESGWRPDFRGQPADALAIEAERAWRILQNRVSLIPDQLDHLAQTRVEVQSCLCDIWHDHVLFTGDEVSGFVDFGSVKDDHVVADLARLLGDLAADDREAAGDGIEAYREVRPISFDDLAYLICLERTGAVLGIANWLRWLYHERRQYDDLGAVVRRLGDLVRRVEWWQFRGA